MSLKNNWILKNLLGAVVLVIALLIGISVGLNVVTRHGKTVTAPDFTNLNLEEATKVARENGVGVKVTDSVFVRRLGAGIVYRQSPKAGATVKKGRSIFLTINSIVPKKVIMPNLVGYSVIEARAELQNRGLNLGRLNYTRDIATNYVLGQKCNGREVQPGDLIVSGSNIDLTVGLSNEESTTTVPRVIGMKYVRAVDAIYDKYLNVGRVRFDSGITTYADSTAAVVYRQDTEGTTRTLGSPVNLYLTLDPEKVPQQ